MVIENGSDARVGRAGQRLIVALGLVALVAACDEGGVFDRLGIASLGADFVRAFNQDPNDTPLDADDVTLRLTPQIEPFNP